MTRPEISDCPDAETFRQWYYLKVELTAFARENGIRTTGGKFEIADRIAHFLEFGAPPLAPKQQKNASRFDWHTAPLSDDTLITDNYKNTQNVRRYFQDRIEGFKFSIALMDWMKANRGKPLRDAVNEALRLKGDKLAGVKQPDQPHNQYNAYTRAYFAAIPEGTAAQARALWAARRRQPGPYVFSLDDLALLEAEK